MIIMSKAGVSFENVKAELMNDEEFGEKYERLKPRYEIIYFPAGKRKL